MFDLIIWFVYIIFIKLDIEVIIFRLWVIKVIVMLKVFCNFLIILRIKVWIVGFRVVVGLFIIKIFGFSDIIDVIVIFWIIFLESLWGYFFIIFLGLLILVNFKYFKDFWYVFFLFFISLLISIFFIIWFLIFIVGFSIDIGFWKIVEIIFFFSLDFF